MHAVGLLECSAHRDGNGGQRHTAAVGQRHGLRGRELPDDRAGEGERVSERVSVGGASPVPLSATVCVPAASVKVSVPVAAPACSRRELQSQLCSRSRPEPSCRRSCWRWQRSPVTAAGEGKRRRAAVVGRHLQGASKWFPPPPAPKSTVAGVRLTRARRLRRFRSAPPSVAPPVDVGARWSAAPSGCRPRWA